jgi:multidrug efflux pump subunit AcrA (membrane-fusion protein)
MGATVNIATVEKSDVLRLPSRAVKNAGSQHIVVVRDDGGIRNVVVETGLSDGNNTEIVSGIGEGTVVVIE